MIAAYIRVSSRGQHHEMQQTAIEREAARRGDKIAETYSEKRTARLLERPELDRLRQEVRAGRITKLYVYRLDRLTRSGIRDTFKLVEELRDHRCELVTVSDGFDVAGPLADMFIAFMAWAAKMETHTRRERQAAARDHIEAKGGRWGRPSSLTGKQLANIQRLKAEKRSIRAIAIALKIPRATVQRAAVSQK